MPRTTSRPESELYFPDTFEERALFVENFDVTPFQFRHCLHRHPAFQLDAILAAAERLTAGKNGKPDWKPGGPDRVTTVKALAGMFIGENHGILKRIHEDAVYREVLREIVPELSKLLGVDLAKVFYDPTMTILVTLPGCITPYHMDCENNLLMQIYGEEQTCVYNGDDASVLSQEDMEKYWTGKLPRVELPATLPHGHWQYRLSPGNGIFKPACYPHWLQNGEGVSVSVSITFKRRHNASVGAHRTNRYLRKLGMRPKAPGQSVSLDRAKEATFGRLYAGAETVLEKMKGKDLGRP